MSIIRSYNTMELNELHALRAQKEEEIRSSQKEIRKLRKKFKSGSYDRQVICEYIIVAQDAIKMLTGSIEGINRHLEERVATAA